MWCSVVPGWGWCQLCGAVWCIGCRDGVGCCPWVGLVCCVGCWGVKGGGVCEVWLGGEVQCSVV